MKKILLLIMVIFSLFLFVSCSQDKKPDIEEKPIEETNKDINEPSNIELPDIKEKYEVYMLNAKLVSGDSDMDDFYNLTKAGNKLAITITKTYEKDYLNSVKAQSEPEVTEGYTNVYELSFDGDNYIYYKLGSDEKYSYKYLNYSEDGVYEGSQVYSKRVSYIIADDPSLTYELYMNAMLSSVIVDDSLFKAMPIVTFLYYDDLVFNKNKIHHISYLNNGIAKEYYSNAFILKDVVDVLNELEWTKDKNSLDISIEGSNEKINISMSRHLVSDKNNLMLHSEEHIDSGNDYLLYYSFFLDSGFVMMGYMTLSSTINNIYAKLTSEQIEKIRGIIKKELVRDFSLGDYTFTSHQSPSDSNYYMVSLRVNNIAKIYFFPGNSQYLTPEAPKTYDALITTGTYSIEKEPDATFNYLVITDGTYTYRFKLTNEKNKGIVFVEEGSNVPSVFSERVSDGDVFYYARLDISSSSYAYLNRLSICDLGEPKLDISNLMEEYAKNVKTGVLDDVLYNVTPSELSGICTIYKFDKSCATFLEYNGKIYQMGIWVGGYGVTQLAYHDTIDKTLLYYINSWGSGIHRSEVFAFDFDDEKIMKVAFEENEGKMVYDIAFFVDTTDNKEIKLSIYKATYEWVNRPYKLNMTHEEVVIDNILNCELVDIE